MAPCVGAPQSQTFLFDACQTLPHRLSLVERFFHLFGVIGVFDYERRPHRADDLHAAAHDRQRGQLKRRISRFVGHAKIGLAIAQMAARTTAPRLSQTVKTRLSALLATLLRHPEARVRLEALGNPSLALLETQGALRAGLFAALSSNLPAEYRAAATAICQSAAARDANLAAQAIAQLQPRRRALSEVLATLSYQVTARRHFSDVTHAILTQLARDPLTTQAAIPFAYAGLSESEWGDWIENALRSGALHADALHAASDILSDEYNAARANRTVNSDESLLARWQSSDAPELRRLALADLVGAAQSGEGWTDERLAKLEKFRDDESLLVAAAAQWIFPGAEAEEGMESDDDLGLF